MGPSNPLVSPASKKKTTTTRARGTKPAASLSQLQKTKAAAIKLHRGSKRTDGAYTGYIKRAKEFLEDLVADRTRDENDSNDSFEAPPIEVIDLTILSKSFDNPPNKYSAMALENFIVQKCLTEDCGKSTSDGIHAAFLRYWDDMSGEKYRGAYSWTETTGKVSGNPARCALIVDLMKTIKNKCGANGGRRNHAEAMTREDLKVIMDWSETICPSDKLETIVDAKERKEAMKHVMMRAFLTSGFTLWTRNFELCSLQSRHVTLGCKVAPYFIDHCTVKLEDRKGWQKKQGDDGPLMGNTYEIYEQKKTPEMDMYTHLQVWMKFLETQLGRSLKPDDYIFPFVGNNGVIYPNKEVTHDIIQKHLTEFSIASGVSKHYTTHCLRRGGAQYRFMFAPLGERWSLTIIRWWGGWAIGEHVDTLIRYLVDSLQSYENCHGDALRPITSEMDQSFNGNHARIKHASAEEFRQLAGFVERKINMVMDIVLSSSTSHQILQRADAAQLVQARTLPSARPRQRHHSRTRVPRTPHSSPNLLATRRYHQTPTQAPSQENDCPHLPPSTGLSIPNLSRSGSAWRDAIKQWEEPHPTSGLPALKDWPLEWYTGRNRTAFAVKRGQRRQVANEYEQCNRDDALFLSTFPEAEKGLGRLLMAIHAKRSARGEVTLRTSKNGAPNERVLN